MSLVRRPRRLLVNLLSIALLFAQFGMAVHASTHLGKDPDSRSVPACDYCLSASALQNPGGGDAGFEITVSVAPSHAFGAPPLHPIAAAAFTAFRSRAPPRFL